MRNNNENPTTARIIVDKSTFFPELPEIADPVPSSVGAFDGLPVIGEADGYMVG